MKNTVLRISIAIGALGAGSLASADSGLFVEPGVTYQAFSSSIDYPSPFSNSTGTVRGLGLMARLGFHITDAVFVALDGRFSRPNFKDSTNNLDSTANYYDLGPVVGLQVPIVGLRVWAGYILSSELDPQSSNNVDFKFSDGLGYRIGAGFHVAIVSLNLEYQNVRYEKTNVEQFGPLNVGNVDSIKYSADGWVLSASFPLNL